MFEPRIDAFHDISRSSTRYTLLRLLSIFFLSFFMISESKGKEDGDEGRS
jgi:hypothetical protein